MKSGSPISQLSTASLKAKLATYFGAHGRFCASHPWEVIVTTVTLTVCVLSVSVLSNGKVGAVCGFTRPCQKKPPEEEKADAFLMIIVNSLAILYLYNQFSSLRKAGSKYLLGIAALFTIFASFVFGSGVINSIDTKATGINEALPFFLLLMDLSKATSLAQFASKSQNRAEVRDNIGKGMSILAPTLSLDTLVEVLIISIGTISGVRQLETVCCFGCISLLANYIVFMTFFPASLALILEVCPHNPSNATWHIDELARDMQQESDKKKPNPVVQRVKIIMALGLVVVHLHSRFLSQVTGGYLHPFSSSSATSPALIDTSSDMDMEQIPLHDYVLWKVFNLSIDQLVTIGLAVVLLIKYTFYDKPSNNGVSSRTLTSVTNGNFFSSLTGDKKNDITSVYFRKRSITINTMPQVKTFPSEEETLQRSTANDRKDSGIGIESRKHEFEDTDGGNSSHKTLLRNVENCDVSVQTDEARSVRNVARFSICDSSDSDPDVEEEEEQSKVYIPPRSVEECLKIFNSEDGPTQLTDIEILSLVKAKYIPAYKLEVAIGNPERGVAIRRKLISESLSSSQALDELPFSGYVYKNVMGACCENVVGYMPLPVGVAGPLLVNGKQYHVPMATTEGCLVASTNRGCRALLASGGVNSHVVGDGMTRGPVLRMPSATRSSSLKLWLDDQSNFEEISSVFNSTSGFAKLISIHTVIAGRLVFVRFKAQTGDAMGMNMLSKGVEKSLSHLQEMFPDLEIISLSGNYCTDKKPSAINWIEGRGKYVVSDAVVSSHVVEKVLKTSVESLIEVNTSKNLVGSAMAGSIGGFNAHAANVVTSIFIATGQDPAQVVGSSNCITLLERGGPLGEDLYISCTMPSLEVGTVGGGTFLPAQSSCLKMLGVHGASPGKAGDNSTVLASVVCATVLAGELSLLSALAAGHLVRSHLTMNRSKLSLPSISETVSCDESCDKTKNLDRRKSTT